MQYPSDILKDSATSQECNSPSASKKRGDSHQKCTRTLYLINCILSTSQIMCHKDNEIIANGVSNRGGKKEVQQRVL